MARGLLGGKPACTRSDIYSLGVVLYQMLIRDFTTPLTTDWGKRISDPLLRADLEKCFAGNPEERFGNARELATNLRSFEKRQTELAEQRAAMAARARAKVHQKRLLCATALAVALAVLGVIGRVSPSA